MSRYINSFWNDHLFFSDEEWDQFIKTIQTNCKFHIKAYRTYSVTRYSVCDELITFRYYIDHDNNERRFRVSNDDRRKIVKYLAKIEKI